MRLALVHPEVPTCKDCMQWIYEENWKPATRGGKQKIPRPKGTKTPCFRCPRIPAGEEKHPGNAVELSEKNNEAWAHYQRCKAVGRFPVDAIVERNAGWIRMVEEQVARNDQLDGAARMILASIGAAKI